MLTTHVQGRATGKSTKIEGLLENDVNGIIMVPFESMGRAYGNGFYRKYKDRIFTVDEFLNNSRLAGQRFGTVYIDEGYLMDEVKMAHLYYKLGELGKDVVVYGSQKGE